MAPSFRLGRFSLAAILLGCLALSHGIRDVDVQPTERITRDHTLAEPAQANQLIRRQPGFFVPNLGQWEHPARFVHRSGPMTLFLDDRGWVIDLVERQAKTEVKTHEPGSLTARIALADDGEVDEKIRGAAVRMTFEGDSHVPEIVGEKQLAGHHNYFLGNDENRWRTGVPLYSSVRYEGLYPGIDLRLREMNGVPEYDLLLQPGANLSRVSVHVEGGHDLSIASDGSLVIETALGPLIQEAPKTWDVGADGVKHEVVCNFTLLGSDRFGFSVPTWGGDTRLTIDPGLIWSTFLGANGQRASGYDLAYGLAVDGNGVVTVTGWTGSINFPTTSGAYDTTFNRGWDIFISRLDPSKTAAAQLVYSTFLGGSSGDDWFPSVSVDASGVVTVTGLTYSTDFPTTSGAYSTAFSGGADIFVSRLDPSKTGTAQLVYSTYLGGSSYESPSVLSIDALGVIAVAGSTLSNDFPMTSGAYDTTYNGGNRDVFVSRLDPTKSGAAQLVYSTFLGGTHFDFANALSVDAVGVMTVVGSTLSANFPTTGGAYDTTYDGGWDVFISRLDPFQIGAAQLVYSTFLAGSSSDADYGSAIAVDTSGVMTLTGSTESPNFPTTSGAFDTTGSAQTLRSNAFVCRLDPRQRGGAQLVYSTFLGGSGGQDWASALAVDAGGVVTVAGSTTSFDFPTTSGAYDTTHNSGPNDAFVSRLDPSHRGSAQLVYSSLLGGSGNERLMALAVDASGVANVAGETSSPNFPTTNSAYNTTYNGGNNDVFVSRLDMGVALYGDVHEIPIRTGGTQRLTVNAGKVHANRLYWILGSITGTKPGVSLLGVHIPLNPDAFTGVAMQTVNTTVFTKFNGTLDSNGVATASFHVPPNLPLPSGFTFYYAYVVYDARGKIWMASNAVPLALK